MRTLFNLLIIAFVIISIFILKDDILTIITQNQKDINIAEKLNLNREVIEREVRTPGPLRVAKEFLETKNESILLTMQGIIDETNKNRKQNGNLIPLILNEKLNKSAQEKVENMFKEQYFEHISLSGISVSDLGDQFNYKYITIGENLALGNFKNDETLVQAWMDSPNHRDNILNQRYTDIGVGIKKGMFEGKETWLAVQHFGLPLSFCPEADQVLKLEIELNKQKLDAIQVNLELQKEEVEKTNYNNQNKVSEYNNLVSKYNNLIKETEIAIGNYNGQVQAFNICIEEFVPMRGI